MRRAVVCVLVLVAVVAAVAACGASDAVAPETTPSSARGTVIALYEAYSEGRDADAHALFAKTKAPGWGYAEPASWRRDLRLEGVGKAVPIRIPGGNPYYERFFDVREASVEYYQAHDVGSRERGDMMEWVMVARETPDGPWRILDVGTGP